MAGRKGAHLEEVVRAYFARQGFFAMRGVYLQFEGQKVTDIDVWLYGRQSASVRTRTVVDVKDKRSPKAFERILWARGLQLALGCDRAVVATTQSGVKVMRFAEANSVGLLHKGFVSRLHGKIDTSQRLTEEQFTSVIEGYGEHKLDGDWKGQLADVKSAVVSKEGYAAFNKAMAAFKFFGERLETRPLHREQALRCSYLTGALACIALDGALERSLYKDRREKYREIAEGVTYGYAADARVRNGIDTVLDVIANGVENGSVVVRQIKDALEAMFGSVRADIVAEYFCRENNASVLFNVARELDDCAYAADWREGGLLSPEAKSVLGVLADFVEVRRTVLFGHRVGTEPIGGHQTGVTGGAEQRGKEAGMEVGDWRKGMGSARDQSRVVGRLPKQLEEGEEEGGEGEGGMSQKGDQEKLL